jgi:epoxyqueuosine reductase
MINDRQIEEDLIAEVQKRDDFRAGIADIDQVLDAPSYKAADPAGNWNTGHTEKATPWLPEARSLLVLAMHHPEDDPHLDWFDRGNTAGNRHMTTISRELVDWLFRTHGLRAQALPYHVEKGGVYLKDAAVFAGLGVVGKNNLLLDQKWGPRVRLRAVLIQNHLPSSGPLENFDPCHLCSMPCLQACPEDALDQGNYIRSACMHRLESNREQPIESGERDSEGSPLLVTDWCRRCEFACPAGEQS